MRERLKILFSFFLFWLGLQIVFRSLFLLYNFQLTSELTGRETMLVFLHGIKMDISMTGYYLMAIGLMLAISCLVDGNWIKIALHSFTGIILLLSAIIVVVDLELYRHWGFRLNTTPLFYAGSEAVGSVDAKVVIVLISIFLVLLAAAVLVYLRTLALTIEGLQPAKRKAFLPLLIIAALMFIPIRGSFTVAPMNTGFVFFHKSKSFANHAAINVTWNFLYSVQSSNKNYPEDFFDKTKTASYFKSLYPESDSTYHLFNNKKPNIILVIMESFTSDVIEPLGGLKDVAPNLSRLCNEGILFDHFYASGDRTDKGIVNILSGYPAQPLTSIIKYPAKAQKLPYLNHHLKDLGYHTSFVYGGDADFANFRSYLANCKFDHLTTEDDFPDEVNYSKWGVHDHLVLDQAFQECDSATNPFFKVILTLSSHEPFDVPMTSGFLKQAGEEGLFLNSCHYTDSALGKFVSEAKSKSWWQNTIMIFVADHGHRLPGGKEAKDERRFRIPLLMIGGAVLKDSVIHTYANQTDIANTLLGQLDHPSEKFIFSKDILSPAAKSFAFYFFNDGYGYVAPGKYVIYDNTGKLFLKNDGATDTDLDITKAYQQTLYSDYNKK